MPRGAGIRLEYSEHRLNARVTEPQDSKRRFPRLIERYAETQSSESESDDLAEEEVYEQNLAPPRTKRRVCDSDSASNAASEDGETEAVEENLRSGNASAVSYEGEECDECEEW